MGNELSGGDRHNHDDKVSRAYDELDDAIKRGDLNAVKRSIEVDGLSPNGAPGGFGCDHPLLGACANADNGADDALIARYLHSKGARGYGIATAVQTSDLERIRELVASGEEELAAGRAGRLLRECRSAEVARWLFDHAGVASDREEAYHVTKACQLGDLDRVKALAAVPGFDVNVGYLEPMPGCGDDIVAYTTDVEREKLNERLIKRYKRMSDTKCTMLMYPLHVVCMRQRPFQPEVAAYLINELDANMEISIDARGRDGGRVVTPLANAVDQGRMEVVEFLVQQGAKAPWESGSEEAAQCILGAAALRGGTQMLQCLLGDKERAKCFDMTCKDKFGRTPLTLACELERKENVEFLLGIGGVAVSPDDVRATCGHCNAAILTLLLDSGGTLPPDNEVVTMLSFQDDGRALAVLKLLHGRGADADLAAAYVETEDGVAHSFFALHDATLHAATSCIEFLLSIGADPDAVGCSPDSSKPGTADDWEGNLGLKYSNVYGDGISLIPSKVEPVKALFERAREAKRGDEKGGETSVRLGRNDVECQKKDWKRHKKECDRDGP